MYLPRSSRWSMTRRRRRPNLFSWTVFGLVILFGYYLNQVYLTAQPNPFEPTPTATRSAESLSTEAGDFFREGKLLQSIDAYEEAINASPQDASLYIELARVQMFAGKFKEAQTNAENALLLNSESSMAQAVLAWSMDFQGNNGDALLEIERAIELDPNNAIAHAYKVEILIDSGSFANIEKAIKVSQDALALNPDLLETRRARGYLLEATSNYEEAIQFYRSAIELNPFIPILHMELGRNLRFLEVYDEAIEEFTLANTLNPPDPEPDLFISRTYATIGDYAKAIQYAETAVKDRTTDPSLRGNWGVMLFRNFQYEQAVEQLGLAVKGGTAEDGLPVIGLPLANSGRVVEYYYTYGLALARTNQCGDALKIAQQVQTAVSEDENALFAAEEIIRICEENLENPPTDVPTEEEIATEEAVTSEAETETPAPEETATP
jgi:tetratricopeptide (TPR) repeat protein